MIYLMIAAMAYLLGSIPFGLILSHVFGLGDVRNIGSGNIGATNVLRTGNKAAAALTLLLDGLKGSVAVFIAYEIGGPWGAQVGALAAFLGHCFPVWLGFKGGKGVATFFGVVLALWWPIGLISAVIWIGVAYFWRISSLAALMAAGWAPLVSMLLGHTIFFPLLMVLAILVYWRHWPNIQRLRKGEEPRIGGGK